MVLSVKEGDTIEQRDIIATLVSMQYERGDLDSNAAASACVAT